MRRILCVGNRLVAEDSLGPRVHDLLARSARLPAGVELVDGGIAGLDLLPVFEGAELVVVVDAVDGTGTEGEVIRLDRVAAAEHAAHRCDHAGGLGYLLRALPAVCEGPLSEVRLVGAGGAPDDQAVRRVAAAALAALDSPRAVGVP